MPDDDCASQFGVHRRADRSGQSQSEIRASGLSQLYLADERPAQCSKVELEKSQRQFKNQQKLLKLLHEAGVPFIAGTDCLNPYCLPGFSLHTELELLVESGMKPMDALRTATINAARFQGKENELGSINAGKAADIVILTANPLESIANTQAIGTVILQGSSINVGQPQRDAKGF